MRILGVIPARWGSSRFPGKPLADINGKSMIERVYERAKKAKSLIDVIVATDDERIMKCVEDFGGKASMTPTELPNGTTRVEYASRKYENIDAVINIQGDEPLLDPEMIDEVGELLRENNCVTLCREITSDYENKNIVKVVFDVNNNALYFSRSKIPYERNKTGIRIYQHIGIYGYEINFLRKYVELLPTPLSETESLEQLKILEHGYKIKVRVTNSKETSIGVDTPEDLERVKEILKGKY